MNKAELINKAAEISGVSKKETEKVANALFDVMFGTLETGEEVQIINFGTFFRRIRKARENGINPLLAAEYKSQGYSEEEYKKMASVNVPEMGAPAFRGSNKLKAALKHI
ncbi:hypothetical protein BC351_10485 [Paenibacillus ferrarius]|uniref:DNA-binding protein n=1 Tax=Paenibacillus ferrarius TaxID=1469647 RepID=A0A1V4H8S2_9BACL|nr:HU family DNA-binding protein [Paenibacillus ferrarius]OPH47610.1 hypothetical protein BC351_10485 [Paenibacillus ferrarius]